MIDVLIFETLASSQRKRGHFRQSVPAHWRPELAKIKFAFGCCWDLKGPDLASMNVNHKNISNIDGFCKKKENPRISFGKYSAMRRAFSFTQR